jgi:hypothetical protein
MFVSLIGLLRNGIQRSSGERPSLRLLEFTEPEFETATPV